MKRITDPRKERYTGNTQTGWKKLQQIEDIEQEIGIDLITLFKALTDTIYYIDEDNKINCSYCPYLVRGEHVFIFETISIQISVKDYGKTWALTKGELENE